MSVTLNDFLEKSEKKVKDTQVHFKSFIFKRRKITLSNCDKSVQILFSISTVKMSKGNLISMKLGSSEGGTLTHHFSLCNQQEEGR